MKLFRNAIAAVLALGAGSAYAFHSGGVAECGGCHAMHTPATPVGGGQSYLLSGNTPSDTCLGCHAKPDTTPSSYHVMSLAAGGGIPTNAFVPIERGPGGDFAWLAITSTATAHGTTTTTPGQHRGHNIYAPDFGIMSDTTNAYAPGSFSGFATSNLGCNSCHDPHGRMRRIATGAAGSTGDNAYTWALSGAPIVGSGSYATSAVPTATAAVGAYRILRGRIASDDPATIPYIPSAGFQGNFLAVAPATYNRTEAATMTRVAYGADGTAGGAGATTDTVGRWCASCHPDMHSTGTSQPLVHPIDQGLGALATNYNNYVSSGIMNGASTSSYLSLVPFAKQTGDFGALKALAVNDNSNLNGPGGTDQVMCLSCHRAHASGFSYMLRWDYEIGEFLTTADSTGAVQWNIGSTNTFTQAQENAGYQDIAATKFGLYQRQLCNKCHAKD